METKVLQAAAFKTQYRRLKHVAIAAAMRFKPLSDQAVISITARGSGDCTVVRMSQCSQFVCNFQMPDSLRSTFCCYFSLNRAQECVAGKLLPGVIRSLD